MKETEVPEDRCGFELSRDEVSPFSGSEDVELVNWDKTHNTVCCWRDVWKEGRCIWHANCGNKPIEKLVATRAEIPERLDGAIFRDLHIDTAISFAECGLIGAKFDNVDFKHTDFSGACLSYSEFSNVKLRKAKFTDTDLDLAIFQDGSINYTTFSDANLVASTFSDIDFIEVEFSGSDMTYMRSIETHYIVADFSNANLTNSNFNKNTFYETEFINANLQNSKFSDTFHTISDFSNANLKGTKFPNASLSGAKFLRSCLYDAEFPEADLQYAIFSYSSGWNVDFSDTDLQNASFPGADLYRANFQNSDIRDAAFTDRSNDQIRPTNLEDTVFEGADIRGTNFGRARLFQAVLTDTRINSRTIFDTKTLYEKCPQLWGWFSHQETPEKTSEERRELPKEVTTPNQAAAWVHRRLESLSEENAMSEEARNFHIRKQEAERKHHNRRKKEYRREGEYRNMLHHESRYWVLTMMRLLTNHGESLRRIFASSAIIILFCGFLYPFVGGFASSESGHVYQMSIAGWSEITTVGDAANSIINSVPILLQSIYFSIITFSTIGYGDLYPTGAGTKILVGSESLAGAVMVALFIFVLSRRVVR